MPLGELGPPFEMPDGPFGRLVPLAMLGPPLAPPTPTPLAPPPPPPLGPAASTWLATSRPATNDTDAMKNRFIYILLLSRSIEVRFSFRYWVLRVASPLFTELIHIPGGSGQ